MPIGASALLSLKLVYGSILKVYSGPPYGMCPIDADLLAFLKD